MIVPSRRARMKMTSARMLRVLALTSLAHSRCLAQENTPEIKEFVFGTAHSVLRPGFKARRTQAPSPPRIASALPQARRVPFGEKASARSGRPTGGVRSASRRSMTPIFLMEMSHRTNVFWRSDTRTGRPPGGTWQRERGVPLSSAAMRTRCTLCFRRMGGTLPPGALTV